jgi:hypothetical protein
MNYPIVPQKRDLKSYSTESIPEGLYIDNNTGDVFASTSLLGWMVGVPVAITQSFIDSETDLQNDSEMLEVQTEEGVENIRLHPESTMKRATEKYAPELLGKVERIGIREVIHRACGFDEILSTQMCLPESDEPQTHWTLYEWMVDNCEIVLEDKLFHKFISKVHGTYKAFYHKNPKTEYRQQVNNPKQVKKLQVYSRLEFPVLQICYTKTLMENCFK